MRIDFLRDARLSIGTRDTQAIRDFIFLDAVSVKFCRSRENTRRTSCYGNIRSLPGEWAFVNTHCRAID